LPDEIYTHFASYLGTSTDEARKRIEEFVETELEVLNSTQRIILVSREFNTQVLSAVFWLRGYSIDIQCTRLSPFLDSNGELFLDPETIVPLPEAKDYLEKKERKLRIDAMRPEWTGYWFVNVGEGEHRNWADCLKFGYLSAGQGPRYSNSLKRLAVGDKIYAYIKGCGYVGFGTVNSEAKLIREYVVPTTGKKLLDCKLVALRAHENSEDPELSEWVVGIDWTSTVPRDRAQTFPGVFANQNVACKLRHDETLKFVAKHFGA
jgi:hypothetical protein